MSRGELSTNKMIYKKIFKGLFIVSGIIVGIVIFPYLLHSCKKAQFELTKVDLPERYRNFATLDSLKDDIYDIIPIEEALIMELEDGTVILETYDDEHKTLYKIGMDNQYHTLKLKGDYFYIFDDYILNISDGTFSHWIRDNNPNFQKIKTDEKIIYTQKEIQANFSNYKGVYSDFIEGDYSGIEEGLHKLFLYNGKEFRIITTRGKYINVDYSNKYNIEKVYLEDYEDFKHIYTYKKEYIEDVFGLSFNPAASKPICWLGDGFFSVKMPQKTLFFKEETTIYCDGDTRTIFQLVSFKNKNLLYIDQLMQNKDFLIRLKNTKNKNATK
ncbi:hypothetical protein [Bergeyella porcorum]